MRFQLIETLLFDPSQGGLQRLSGHLERLRSSSQHFGYPFSETAILDRLQKASATLCGPTKLRMLLSGNGEITIETQPLEPLPVDPFILVSKKRTQPSSKFISHKTTCRELYENEYARLNQSAGCYDVIFLNLAGELTEGSRHNLYIEKDGEWFTPPQSSGLLPGVMRRSLLESGKPLILEKVLGIEDLEAADRIYLSNSLRGLVEVRWDQRAEEPE